MSELPATASHPSGLQLHQGPGEGLGFPFAPSRGPLFQPTPLNTFMSRYYYLLSAMGVFSSKARLGVASEAVFRSIEEQATQDVWWRSLKLPKNWITEHAMLSLHVWMFHCRWKVEYNLPGDFSGRRMQEEVFARLWEDTMLRIRNAGVAEISVNKQLENVQKVTFDDMFGYDAAWRVQEEDEGMELAAALWKGVWREDEGADTEAVLLLADYVRREVLSLCLQPKEDVYRGWVTWGPAVGEAPAERQARQARMLEGEWREGLAQDGRLFFYHTATQERRWEPPEEGYYGRQRFSVKRFADANPQLAGRLKPAEPLLAAGAAPAAGALPASGGATAAAGAASASHVAALREKQARMRSEAEQKGKAGKGTFLQRILGAAGKAKMS